MSLFLGQSYRQIRINMHTWRGIGIFSYFCDNWRKTEFPTHTPCARNAETHMRRTRAAAGETARERQARYFDNLRQLCWQFLLINLAS